MDDVVVVGGSFAGLTAAMHLVRARRKVTILDTGLPRNRFAEGAHNVLGFDGAPPEDIRTSGLANVLAYPTARHVVAEAVGVGGVADDFVVRATGGQTFPARRLILSYGITDQFPDIPGFVECWGRTVIHCPYCHGYEVADGRLGLLYSGPNSLHFPTLLGDWSRDLTVLTNGLDLPDGEVGRIEARGVKVVAGRAAAILHEGDRIRAVRLENGEEVALDALFAHPRIVPSSRLHEDLGVETSEGHIGDYIEVDEMFATNVPGVFAAGDVAGMRHSINSAIYGGSMAAMACHRSLFDWS
jgi:thioredoxin reductase